MVEVNTTDDRLNWNETWRTWSAKASDLGWLLGPVRITDMRTGESQYFTFQYKQVDNENEILAWWFIASNGTKLKLLRA
jgi:hypothetical protein